MSRPIRALPTVSPSRNCSWALLLVLALFVAPGQATAGFLTITNPGFESQSLLDGHTIGSILGWTQAGGGLSGVVNPASNTYSGGVVPEGNNVAYTAGLGEVVSQTLSDTLQANTRYILTMEVGDRLNQSFAGYRIELRAGGNLLAFDQSSITPGNGQFAQVTVTYDSLSSGPYLGQALAIHFRHTILTGLNYTDYDNVQLEARAIVSAVPEPTSLTLLGVGLATLVATRWRRR